MPRPTPVRRSSRLRDAASPLPLVSTVSPPPHALPPVRRRRAARGDNDDADDTASEYERQRRHRIQRNAAALHALTGDALATAVSHVRARRRQATTAAQAKRAATRAARRAVPESERRRSSRVAGKPVDYTRELIDTHGEELDRALERRPCRPPAAAKLATEDAVARCQAVMDAVRAEYGVVVSGERSCTPDAHAVASQLKAEGHAAKALAVSLWGTAVVAAGGDVSDWDAYVASRKPSPPACGPSPLALMQERFGHSPWKLLMACALITRTSSKDVKERCVADFFRLCPTPTAFLAAPTATVREAIHSLGLFPDRFATMTAVTSAWLSRPTFEVGLHPDAKIRGCGPFVVDSYRLFVLDDPDVHPTDKNLAAYKRWRDSVRRADGTTK